MNDVFVAAASRVAVAEVGGEAVLLDLQTGQYYGVNEVGTRIWELVQEPRSLESIVDELERQYEVGRDLLETDAGKFLEQLLDHDLVERKQ